MKKLVGIFSGVCFFLFIVSFQVFKMFDSLGIMKFSYSMLALSALPLLALQVKRVRGRFAGLWLVASAAIDIIFAAVILFLLGFSPLESGIDPTLFIALMLVLASALFSSLKYLNIALRKRHIKVEKKRRTALA